MPLGFLKILLFLEIFDFMINTISYHVIQKNIPQVQKYYRKSCSKKKRTNSVPNKNGKPPIAFFFFFLILLGDKDFCFSHVSLVNCKFLST